MYTLGIAGIVAAYVLVAVLLLSINLYSNWSWRVKATSIIITTAFYIVTYMSFPPLLGWPTSENPPERFRLISAYVHQPNKVTGHPGAVYLWLGKLEDLTDDVTPRAYELPYTNMLHEMVIIASSRLDKGIAQLGEFDDELDNNLKPLDKRRSGQESVNLQFYDLPDPLFPEK